MRTLILGSLASIALTACIETPPPSSPKHMAAPPVACGADQLQDRLGTAASVQDFSAYPAKRVLPPDSVMTLDHRPDRLNIDTDARGMITRLWCG